MHVPCSRSYKESLQSFHTSPLKIFCMHLAKTRLMPSLLTLMEWELESSTRRDSIQTTSNMDWTLHVAYKPLFYATSVPYTPQHMMCMPKLLHTIILVGQSIVHMYA